MTLKRWLENRWLVEHRTTREEIASLCSVIDRDLRDAGVSGLSPDWRLAIAYNAVLQCAVVALAVSGYRPGKNASHHYYAIESLAFTLQVDTATLHTLDMYRKKRNVSDYERAGTVTETEVSELVALATELRERLRSWLASEHPALA